MKAPKIHMMMDNPSNFGDSDMLCGTIYDSPQLTPNVEDVNCKRCLRRLRKNDVDFSHDASVAIIHLTKGHRALIDADDYERISHYFWAYNELGYARAHVSVIRGSAINTFRSILLHRLILNAPDDIHVDHINGDKLDNRKANLRLATRTKNEWNKPKQKTAAGKPCTSKYKGVSLVNGRWRAQIKRNGVLYELGAYANEEAAAIAYNKKAIELSGEFLWINPLPELTTKSEQKDQS